MPSYLQLERDGAAPLPEQIYRQLLGAIRSGHFGKAGRLPSSRALAAELEVSRNTVNAAYELLRAEGVVSVKAGAAPAILPGTGEPQKAVGVPPPATGKAPLLSTRGLALSANVRAAAYSRPDGLLQPGVPDEALFPRDLWARSLRRAARSVVGRQAVYDHFEGLPVLRQVLARYLAAERGVVAEEGQIIVTGSSQAALALIALSLAEPGETVWMEEPGYLGARAAFTAAGLTLRPLPVDSEGANPAALEAAVAEGREAPPRLIYLTPSHQYPTGVRMTLPRRLALLEAARRLGAVVVEDDYDSEFLWRGRPLAALQGLGQAGEVIYLATSAKSLLPGLRLAYMAVPGPLAGPLRLALRNLGALANVHAQAALADFIDAGHYRAHLRRIARSYEERCQMLVAALGRHLGPGAGIEPPTGGLQIALNLPAGTDDFALSRALAARGYSVPALSAYYLGPSVPGLLIGFGAVTPALAERFAGTLAGLLKDPAFAVSR
ncbi:MocR-like pyridoxine biosynthesis transcription factor PdxR [Radicibacter daui]|uniref:MocR-like pyridoxine biosynthesis transcription factor PdxR n=1 Tax=Radicibacter daui TaxID=3064829 RepID=UPI004046A9DE